MSFGQAAGPPASHQQLSRLAELLEAEGYESFREARHIYGLSQRQAGGKFTRDEADELLARLEDAADEAAPAPAAAPEPPPARPDDVVLAFPDEMLAEELARRGWTCTPPP